jgi:hypothetical protein
MHEKYPTKDRRGLVWLNEIGVLRVLAYNKNDPLYPGKIASIYPDIRGISRVDLKMFTRPGVKAACQRLVERGILEETPGITPNKSEPTSHYRIVPDLEVFSLILSDYGSGILDDIRSTPFGQDTIEAGIKKLLKKRLFFDRDLDGIAPVDDLKMMKEFACLSTTALEVLLSDNISLGYDVEKDHSKQMQLRIRHLREIMNFATAFDISKKPAAQLVGEDLKSHFDLESEITKGSTTLRTKSDYDTEEIAGEQRALAKKQRESAQTPQA